MPRLRFPLQATLKACTGATDPGPRAVPGAEAPDTAAAPLAQPAVIGPAGPLIDLLTRGIERNSVALLDAARELIAAACGHCEIIVRELSPFLSGSALELLPIAFDSIPVHHFTPCRVVIGH